MKSSYLKIYIVAFICLFILLQGCEKEDSFSNKNSQQENEFTFKKITFNELKSNKKAFEKLQDARSKRFPDLQARGVYDESYGVFVDTTNIIVVEKDGRHSITLQIDSELDGSKMENLVLNSSGDGSYTAYIAEYLLSPQEFESILNGSTLSYKMPSSITQLETASRISIGGDGAECVDIVTTNVSMCYNAQGNTQLNNGDLGNGCVGVPFDTTVTTLLYIQIVLLEAEAEVMMEVVAKALQKDPDQDQVEAEVVLREAEAILQL